MPHHTATDAIAPVKSVRALSATAVHSIHVPHAVPDQQGTHAAGQLHASHQAPSVPRSPQRLTRLAAQATLHCLTGCAIGEVLGMVLGTAWGWSNGATIALAVTLAFVFGYALTAIPLLKSGLPTATALKLALAADTASIFTMEVVDNAIMLAIPGAMDAPLTSALFWGSMIVALVIAGFAAYPVNRWLIARGKGHELVHVHH
ncbi:MAG: DUF4396 domain-containing protein [Burkholderiales bacterium]|nr:DUF4396 domain-containing protein [Burkholderiales bacterium]